MKNLVSLKPIPGENLVFVGDTHGDLEATRKVIEKYLKPSFRIVFLGDYVDRGSSSKENIDFLLEMRRKNPKQIFLLLGNHDAYNQVRCYPANFWDGLNEEETQKYAKIFEKFPLMLVCGGIMAVHGGLPDVKNIKDIEKIEVGDKNWMAMAWGDFQDKEEDIIQGDGSERPQFGKKYFERVMSALGKRILIRAHQPNAPERMFNGRCVTIFTSNAYGRKRVVCLVDSEGKAEIEEV